MELYHLVEQKLTQIQDGTLQMIGDAFLHDEWGVQVHSTGKVAGLPKSKKGHPDAYALKDELYLLAEYTTQSASPPGKYRTKLLKDLHSCLNEKKHGIPLTQVHTILLFTIATPSTKLHNELHELAKSHQVDLEIVSLTKLTTYLTRRGKQVASDLLQVPFDVGQVSSLDEFIALDSRKNAGTTLTNTFFGRENEIAVLQKALDDHDLVLVSGKPGVGKTRIVLEAIRAFQQKHPSFGALAINIQPHAIYNHLHAHMQPGQDYILFIDDAIHQLHNLEASLFYVGAQHQGKVKIMMTVRDYAKADVMQQCKDRTPFPFTVGELPTEHLLALLYSPDIGLTQDGVALRIRELASGNPRLAIMMAEVTKSEPNFDLKDLAAIYEKYFTDIYQNKDFLTRPSTIRALGLLSFFETIDICQPKEAAILEHFGVRPADFYDECLRLEAMEMVEILRGDMLIKLPDQNLRTFLFYKTFIKDGVLSFSMLLQNYFQDYAYWMRECLDSAILAFGKEKVIGVIGLIIEQAWQDRLSNAEALMVMAEVFGKYYPNKLFAFIKRILQQRKEQATQSIHNNAGDMVWVENIGEQLFLQLLQPFFANPFGDHFQIAMELLDQMLPSDLHRAQHFHQALISELRLDEKDGSTGFATQHYLLDKMQYPQNSVPIIRFYLDVFFRHAIGHFHQPMFETGEYASTFLPAYASLREAFWRRLSTLLPTCNDLIIHFLYQYSEDTINHHLAYTRTARQFDVGMIEQYLLPLLDPTQFDHCYFVVHYLPRIQRKALSPQWLRRFTNKSITIHQAFSVPVDELRDRFSHIIYNEAPIQTFRTERVKAVLPACNWEEFQSIFSCIEEVAQSKEVDPAQIREGLDLYLSLIMAADEQQGFQCLTYYLDKGAPCKINPRRTLIVVFSRPARVIWQYFQLMQTHVGHSQLAWIAQFFWQQPPHTITYDYAAAVLTYYQHADKDLLLSLELLKKYEPVRRGIIEEAVSSVIDRRQADTTIRYEVSPLFMRNCIDEHLLSWSLCEKLYLQATILERNFDFDSHDLWLLCKHNWNFLYTSYEENFSAMNNKPLQDIWNVDDHDNKIMDLMEYLMEHERTSPYIHLGLNIFSRHDHECPDAHQVVLKRFIKKHAQHLPAINLVFDIARNCYEKADKKNPTYAHLVQYFVTLNVDLPFFQDIAWHNNHFSSTGSHESWAEYREKTLDQISRAIAELPNKLQYVELLAHLDQLKSYERGAMFWEQKHNFRMARFR